MKKRILSSVMALCLVMTLLPMTALAAETPVAKIGENTYDDLTSAINAATEGQTVTLLEDVTGQVTIPAEKSIVLDLNGKKVETAGATTIVNNGKLTVKDSGTDGKIVSTGHCGIVAGNNSTTIIESGIIESVEGAVITGTATGATIEIKGGTLSASDNAVVAGNGTSRDGDANKITISGGTFNGQITTSGYVACGVYAPWKDEITITGGTFNITGGAGVVARAGTVTVTGGTFNCTGSATGKVGDSRVVVPCSALVFDEQANYPGMTDDSKITVNGGTFSSAETEAGAVYVLTGTNDTTNRVTITAGTFVDSTNNAADVSKYYPEGALLTQDNGGTVVAATETEEKPAVASVNGISYTSLEAAIAAASDGDTVTLLKNTEVSALIEISKNLVIDFNNCELTSTYSGWAVNVVSGTVTLQNGTVVGTKYGVAGRADADLTLVNMNVSTTDTSDGRALQNQGTMTIKSGTYTTVSGATAPTVLNVGDLTIEGGTFNTGSTVDNQSVLYCSKENGVDSTTTVTGGTFTNDYGYGISCMNGASVEFGGTASVTSKASALGGNNTAATENFTVTGGTLISTDGPAIFFPAEGTLKITGGTITGKTGIHALMGTIEISGGKITGNGSATDLEEAYPDTGSGSRANGSAILLVTNKYTNCENNNDLTLNITGGEFISTTDGVDAITKLTPTTTQDQTFTPNITGGEYSSSVIEFVADSVKAELYSETKNEDAPYSYYTDVSAALADAQPGDTVNNLNGSNEDDDELPVVTLDYGYDNNKITVKTNTITLPTLTRPGYTFLGWYKDGVQVNDAQGLSANTTFTAKWSRNSSGGSGTTTYAVNLPSDVTNGTLAASPKSAAKGTTVTLTVTPAEGYQLDKLTVTDANGNAIALTKKSDTQYTFVMPASKVNVAATFEKIPAVHDCPSEKFTDVDQSAWYHEGVDYAILKGMMNGTEPTLFEPNSTTTRAMIVTILYRLEGEPAVSGSSVFTDVDAGTWYTDAVAWAADKGVVTGTTPTTFDPNDPITREQMAAILYRYASYKGYDVSEKANLSSYTDAAQISAYAVDAMAWTNAEGLVTGETPTTLVPQGNATRAQVATILMRFCENVAK